jgi:hypothetical protein
LDNMSTDFGTSRGFDWQRLMDALRRWRRRIAAGGGAAATAALSVALLGGPAGGAAAASIVVDGNVADWGVVLHNGGNTTYGGSVYTGVIGGYGGAGAGAGLIGVMSPTTPGNPNGPNAEDTDDRAALSTVVTPWTGGQKYDAEFMAVALDRPVGASLREATISILVVSGLRPDNGSAYFAPGDIRIDGLAGSFGIEVGGGAAHTGGAAVAQQTEASDGWTYDLSRGEGGCIACTLASTPTTAATAGSIWKDPTWLMDPLASAANGGVSGGAHDDPTGHPTDLVLYPFEDDDRNQIDHANPGQNVTPGGMKYRYTADELMDSPGVKSVHSAIEMSFSADPFVVTDENGHDVLLFSVTWGPGCNNDVLRFDASVIELGQLPTATAPEPPAFAALAGMMAGLGLPLLRRRRAARKLRSL